MLSCFSLVLTAFYSGDWICMITVLLHAVRIGEFPGIYDEGSIFVHGGIW